jgi:hypothetical protein
MGNHAIFGPSGLSRVKGCPGHRHVIDLAIKSGLISGESEDSAASALGTLKHEATEQLMSLGRSEVYDSLDDQDRAHVDKAIADLTGYLEDLEFTYGDYKPLYEFKVNPRNIFHEKKKKDIPNELWGTCDFGAYFPDSKHGVIDDHKFGAWEVSIDSWQIKAYGVGFIALHPELKTIDLCITQPRVYESFKVKRFTRDELVDWAATEYLPAILAALEPDAQVIPDRDWCHFCLASGVCTKRIETFADALAETQRTEAKEVLKDFEKYYDVTQLDRLAPQIKLMKSWLAQYDKVVTRLLMNGAEFKNIKLADKRANRKWKDGADAEKFMARLKIKKADRGTFKLLSPAQFEKLGIQLGPKYQEDFEDLVHQPHAGWTWVPSESTRKCTGRNVVQQKEAIDLLEEF